MTFDPTKPVQTRDGRKARIICTDLNNPAFRIVAVIDHPGGEYVETYGSNGRKWEVSPQSVHDLINVPETKSWWVNVYATLGVLSQFSQNKEQADGDAGTARTSILEIRMCDGKHVETIQHEVEK